MAASFMNKVIRAAGSIRLGMVLILVICAYLSAATIPPAAVFMARILGISPSGLYGCWVMILLCTAVCVNTAVGTVTRIVRKWRSAGAYMAHLGIILLAAGSVIYTTAREEGYAVTMLMRDGTWSDIDEYYIADTNVMTARFLNGQLYRTELEKMPGEGESVEIKAPHEVEVRMTGWEKEVQPVETIDIRLEFSTGEKTRFESLTEEHGRDSIDMGSYDIQFRAHPTMAEIRSLLFPKDHKHKKTGSVRPRVILIVGNMIKPQIAIVMSDDMRRTAPMIINQPVVIPFTFKNPVTLTVMGKYLAPGSGDFADTSHPPSSAAELEITSGDWKTTTLLPKHRMPGMPMPVPLPGGKNLFLELMPGSRPLGATIGIDRVEYVPYIGTKMPKDYVTDVTVRREGESGKGTIKLNHPVMAGPYQLSQNTWGPEPSQPRWIILGVATRPGIFFIWAGFILLCLSMPVAFYLKPLLVSRKAEES
jgi:hypothetical protein